MSQIPINAAKQKINYIYIIQYTLYCFVSVHVFTTLESLRPRFL